MKRPFLDGRTPALVTIRIKSEAPSLRSRKNSRIVENSLVSAKKFGGRILRLSIRRRLIRLLVEAPDNVSLGKTVQSFGIRLAKALHRGGLTKGRYGMDVLKSPRQVAAALKTLLGSPPHGHRETRPPAPELLSAPLFGITREGFLPFPRP